MLALALIGLVGGLVTGISPCVLPVLPVVFLSSGAGGSTNRSRPVLVVAGLVTSFAAITLAGTLVLDALPLPSATFRDLGLGALVLLGLATMFPALDALLQRPFARAGGSAVRRRSGFLLGLALGAVYVPCAGPVLAAITVAGATGDVSPRVLVLTAAFAAGTAVPLLLLALAGQRIGERLAAYRRRQHVVRVVAGSAVLLLAGLVAFHVTDVVQRAVPDYTAAADTALQHRLGGSGCDGAQLADCGQAPAISGVTAWLGTPGGSPATTAGHVTLVDFWAYSCINCQRAVPHLEAWYRAYQQAGLQVIGVQTPEYDFERSPDDVAAGAKRLGITYPVAVDDDYTTWDAFHNDAWPTDYLVDASGRIRHVTIGEGGYATTEALLRQLLSAADPSAPLPAATDVPDTEPTDHALTPETYLGSQHETAGLQPLVDGTAAFTAPTSVPDGRFALGGTWTVGDESLTAGAGAHLLLGATASHVYLDVAGTGTVTAVCDGTARTVELSGAPDIHDVCDSGGAPGRLSLDLTLSPGLSAYSFTFG